MFGVRNKVIPKTSCEILKNLNLQTSGLRWTNNIRVLVEQFIELCPLKSIVSAAAFQVQVMVLMRQGYDPINWNRDA